MPTKTDVIIPTYKPDERLFTVIEKLRAQTAAPNRIVLINTEKKYLDELLEKKGIDASAAPFEIMNT